MKDKQDNCKITVGNAAEEIKQRVEQPKEAWHAAEKGHTLKC